MSHGIRRRDFLSLTAGMGLGFPALFDMAHAVPAELLSIVSGERSNDGIWDYVARPVVVKNPALNDTWNNGARFAFDGYGGSRRPASIAHAWVQPGSPSRQEPFFCTIDYGSATAITKFVHHFYTPRVLDYRTDPLLLSSAFKSINVYRSDDGVNWGLADSWNSLSVDWPQVFALSTPKPARYYKMEITELVPGAEGVRTYEMETFTGPVIGELKTQIKPLKAGDQIYVAGAIVGAESSRSYHIVVEPSARVVLQKTSTRVEPGGTFRLGLTVYQCGVVAVPLELKDSEGRSIDRRTISLHILPRVVLSAVTASGNEIIGKASNTSTASLSIDLESSGKHAALGTLAPNQEREFRLPARGDQGIVEVKVSEDAKGISHWAFPVEIAKSEREAKLVNQTLAARLIIEEGRVALHLTPSQAKGTIRSALVASYDGSPLHFSFYAIEPEKLVLCGRHATGAVMCVLELVDSGVRATFRQFAEGLQEEQTPGVLDFHLQAEGVKFRFVPASVNSREPISTYDGVYGTQPLVRGAWFAPTRMVSLETENGTVGLVPDRDRCLMGIEQDDAVVRTRLGSEQVDILIIAVAGDWFESFRHVVTDVYRFEEPRQYSMLVEAVSEEARYLTSNMDIWSQKLGVVTSFPKRDYVFLFYGLVFTIPALYAWYQISGNKEALDRVRKCVRYLLEYPGVKINEGPTAGAFYSQFGLRGADNCCGSGTVNGGGDAGNHPWLEPHATGAAAWVLLHYYEVDGKRDREVLTTVKAGLDWLLKIQNPDGGWVYAYNADGTKVTETEGAGNIWGIWALYRYGKLTSEAKYLEAAERGKLWFASTFIANHVCNGYWEDTAAGSKGKDWKDAGGSWEAYEFAVATNVFAEMGEKDLAVEAAKNAVTWVWTRTLDCRDYFNSYGGVHEQWGWPPGSYVAPMFGVAAQTAYRLTGDEFFHRFGGAAKTIGWWATRRAEHGIFPDEATPSDLGGSFWPLEGTEFVPLEEPLTVSFWDDWISAQQCTLCLRWLVNEVNQKSGGKIAIDAETLSGTVLGRPGKVKFRPDEFSINSQHRELNWLGYETENSKALALINHDEATSVQLSFAESLSSPVSVVTGSEQGLWTQEVRQAGPLKLLLPKKGCVLIVWRSA